MKGATSSGTCFCREPGKTRAFADGSAELSLCQKHEAEVRGWFLHKTLDAFA